MEEKILTLIMEILKIDHAKLNENMENRDIWDSLRRVEILFAIEDEFDIFFEEDELKDLTTPGALCRAVLSKAE